MIQLLQLYNFWTGKVEWLLMRARWYLDVTLNFSPLRGYDDVSFISSAEELVEKLYTLEKFNSNIDQGVDFFYIDKDLPKWQELLVWNVNWITIIATLDSLINDFLH